MSSKKNPEKTQRKRMSLAMQIFIALILAIIAGLLMQKYSDFAVSYIKPFGTIFLNLVKFIVGPIVLFSIMSGVISLKDIRKVESIGGITVVYYFCTTAVATVIGLVIANLFHGFFPVLETSSLTYEAPAATSPMDVIVNIFPSNFLAPITEANMLQVIVMALLIGFAVILIGEKASAAVNGINRWNDIFMKVMEMILKLSPLGVFALLCPVVAENGAKVIGSLAMVLLAAYIGYLLHAIVVYSLTVRTLGGLSPIEFARRIKGSFILRTSPRGDDQYGRYSDLSGCLRNLYRFLLWDPSDIVTDGQDRSYGNPGVCRNSRRARSRHDHAGHGTCFRRTPDRRYCAGSRRGPYI